MKQPNWAGSPAAAATQLNLPKEAVDAAANRPATPEERRLPAEHEVALPENWAVASNISFPFACLKMLIRLDEMVEPSWWTRALGKEAEQRQLRRFFEKANSRPWVAVTSNRSFDRSVLGPDKHPRNATPGALRGRGLRVS